MDSYLRIELVQVNLRLRIGPLQVSLSLLTSENERYNFLPKQEMSVVEYIYVDSRTRDSNLYPSGNSYTVYLTNPLKNISKVELISAKVPNTIYNLNLGSNVLNFGGTSNLSLASGFYSASTLANEIVNTGRLPSGASVYYSTAEGKYIFYSTSSFSMNVTTREMATITGMPFGVVQSATQIAGTDLVYGSNPTLTGKYVLKSSNVADFSTNEFLFLDVMELRSQSLNLGAKITGNTITTSTASHAFGPVTLDVISGSVKTFKENGDYSLSVQYPHVVELLSRLTIRWVDINGNPVIFNGAENNSFMLRVTRTDVPPTLDRETGLPPPVPWNSGQFNNPVFIIGIAMVLGLFIIVFSRRKST